MKPSETLRRYVRNARGDYLHRARAAFRNCSPEQMNSQYGQSGKTRNEIIADYERFDAEWQAAHDLLERLLRSQ